MQIMIFGARGSIPTPSCRTPMGKFTTEEFGGNTTCFLIETENDTRHIVDAGTGIRNLGQYLISQDDTVNNMHLYFTHTHWDHIQGFPFFAPAYNPNSNLSIYGEAKVAGGLIQTIDHSYAEKNNSNTFSVTGDSIQNTLRKQQEERNFPAPLGFMKGIKNFHNFLPGGIIFEDDIIRVETQAVNHPGGCVSYRFTEKSSDTKLVIATDFEPDRNIKDQQLIHWWQDADLVLADAQYEVDSEVNPFMTGWGHSDYVTDIQFAYQAKVKNLLLVHHEPKMDDKYHRSLERKAQRYAKKKEAESGYLLDVSLAREGAIYTVGKKMALVS